MTDQPTPTRVVLYCYARNLRPENVAVFTWDAQTGVSLTVLDEEYGALARDYYAMGVLSKSERRLVLPAEGDPFMRALVHQRNRSTYYQFADVPE